MCSSNGTLFFLKALAKYSVFSTGTSSSANVVHMNVGGVCGENAHETTFKLDFLQPGKTYEATLYADAPDADYETNPQAYTITHSTVTSADVLTVRMARSGGFGLSLREK